MSNTGQAAAVSSSSVTLSIKTVLRKPLRLQSRSACCCRCKAQMSPGAKVEADSLNGATRHRCSRWARATGGQGLSRTSPLCAAQPSRPAE